MVHEPAVQNAQSNLIELPMLIRQRAARCETSLEGEDCQLLILRQTRARVRLCVQAFAATGCMVLL